MDNICNQGCRKRAPQLSLVSGTTLKVTDASGKTKEQDLTDVGDVFGEPVCAPSAASGSATCTVRSAEQDSSGAFIGGYSPPALIPTKTQLRERRERLLSDEDASPRELQAVQADSSTVKNPVYCITVGSSFLFTVSDPKHYPVYLRDSVLNTNPDFDYGAFLDF